MMFRALLLTALLLQSAPATQPASETPTTAPAAGLTVESGLDEVLIALDERGRSLRTLAAKITLSEEDAGTGEGPTRSGQFWLMRSAGDSQLRVVFDRTERSGKVYANPEDKIEYLLAGDWLIDRVYKTRAETHRQVRKPGETSDLLKLGEGPFPLPIGQAPDAVRQQFTVTRLPADPDHPGTIPLELRPREHNRLARRLESITVWVDPALAMPVFVQTIDANQVTIRSTRLEQIRINQDVSDASFKLNPIDQDAWSIVKEAYEE